MNGASQGCFIKALSPATLKIVLLSFLAFQGMLPAAHAQNDTAKKMMIEILPSSGTQLQYLQTDSGAINKLIHDVQLRQGDAYMYCDSAYIHLAKNNLQAFGNVRIVQTGTQVISDYLRYTGNTKKAFLQGNVNLTDGTKNLWSEELYYDVATKVGTYQNGGTLQNDATTLSSNSGYYNSRTKDARFTGDVFVTDPKYQVTSNDIAYNTQTEIVQFLAPSVVTNDSAVLHTRSGTWDAKKQIAQFNNRSSLQDRAQYIEADQLNYNRITGFGTAKGKVISIDTAMKATLYCEAAQYSELTKQLYATGFPVMKKMNGVDSIFIRADTFFAAPIMVKDTLKKDAVLAKKGKKNNVDDTVATSNSSKRYFIGYHKVMVYSDSLQAVCDSISYSQQDSTMRLMYQPIVWSRQAQISGDTILLYTDSQAIKKIFVPSNALLISQSGPEAAELFDQVQGNTMTGYFEKNQIKELVVFPNAEAIYYSKDEKGAYLGVDETQCERMKVYFDEKEISTIKQYQDIKHKMTPMQQALQSTYRLSRFKWLIVQRPKSLQELLDFGKAKEMAPSTNKPTPPATPVKPSTKNKKTSSRNSR